MRRKSTLPGAIFLAVFMIVGIGLLVGGIKLAISTSEGMVAIFVGGMGMIYLLVSAFMMYILLKDDVRRARLLAKGKVLPGKIEYFEQIRTSGKNGTHRRISYVIICSYEDMESGMQYRFKSETLSSDPSRLLDEGSPIDIYVNEKDYSKHYVAVQEELQKRKIVCY